MAQTSTSGRKEMQWGEIEDFLKARIKFEPYMVRDNFGFRDLDSMFALVETCFPFHQIISTRPAKSLPSVVSAFFYNWNEGDSVSSHTVSLGSQNVMHTVNVLNAVKAAFGIGDGGTMQLSEISRDQLQQVADRVLIEQRQYVAVSFKRNELRPKFRLLMDFVQKCFLGHIGNYDQVTPFKFQILAAVILDLPISWAKLMVSLLWDEARQIVCETEGEAVVKVSLHNNKPIRLGTKATCIVISFFKSRKWSREPTFPPLFIPKDLHQLEMAIGVAPQIYYNSPDNVRQHIAKTGESKVGWRIPARPVQKKRKADVELVPSRPAKKTSPAKRTPPRRTESASSDPPRPLHKTLPVQLEESAPHREPSPSSSPSHSAERTPSPVRSADEPSASLQRLASAPQVVVPSPVRSPPVVQRAGSVEIHDLTAEDSLSSPLRNVPVEEDVVLPIQPFSEQPMSAAHSQVAAMKAEARLKVIDLMPGIAQLPKSLDLATRLQFYLDCKSSYYFVFEALLQVVTLDDLKVEELALEAEFGFFSVEDAASNFQSIVLRRMKVEAKILGIDLRPLYTHSRALYNSAINVGDEFEAIRTPEQSPSRNVGGDQPLVADAPSPQSSKIDVEVELNSLSAKLDSLVISLPEQVKQAVAEARVEIVNEAKTQADEASRTRCTDFAVNLLKEYTDKLLPAQLVENNVAKLENIGEVKEEVAKVDERVNELTTSITNSASASNAQINAILETITSLLDGQQQLRESVAKLQEEDASLLSRINTLSDDVEKGEEARAAAARKKRPSKAKSPPSSSVPPPPPPPPRKTAPQAVASKDVASQADPIAAAAAAEAAAAKARLAKQADLISAMTLAGATPEQAVDPEEQRRFIAKRRAEEERKKKEKDWISQSALVLNAGVQQQAVEWLDERQNNLLRELNSCFILLHYWIQDPSLPADADEAYAAYMLKFPYQDFIGELRKKAAEAGAIVRAPAKQFFAPLLLGGSGYLDYSRIDQYIAQTAIGLNVNVSNSDPAFRRIRDGIYASMKAKSREQIQEERIAARAQRQ